MTPCNACTRTCAAYAHSSDATCMNRQAMTQNAPAACHVAGAFSRFAVPVERAHALPAAMRLMQAVPARPSGRTRLGCMTTAPQIKTTNRNAVGTTWHGAPGAVRRVAAAMPGRGAGGISLVRVNRDAPAMPGRGAGGISTYWGEPRDDAAMPGRGAGGISLDGVNPGMTQQCPVTCEWYLTGRGEP